MSRLVETIRLEDGKLLNVRFHNERMNSSLYDLFGYPREVDLQKLIAIPSFAESGIFKCRVEYFREILNIEFIPYIVKEIKSLKIVEDNIIVYNHKFTDRRSLDELLKQRGEADDILIIKNGMVTDTSFSNVVFRNSDDAWVTPSTCLLPGTRRASLLSSGDIRESVITYRDIGKYIELKLINAMIGLDDTYGIPIGNIY